MYIRRKELRRHRVRGDYHCAALWSGVAALDKTGHHHKDAVALAYHAALSFKVAATCRNMCGPERAPDAVSLSVPDQIATGQEGFKHSIWQAMQEGQVSQHLHTRTMPGLCIYHVCKQITAQAASPVRNNFCLDVIPRRAEPAAIECHSGERRAAVLRHRTSSTLGERQPRPPRRMARRSSLSIGSTSASFSASSTIPEPYSCSTKRPCSGQCAVVSASESCLAALSATRSDALQRDMLHGHSV